MRSGPSPRNTVDTSSAVPGWVVCPLVSCRRRLDRVVQSAGKVRAGHQDLPDERAGAHCGAGFDPCLAGSSVGIDATTSQR